MAHDHQTEPDDLVERLRDTPNWLREGRQPWKDSVKTYDRAPFEAAARILADAEVIKAAEELEKALDKHARSGTTSLICWDDVIDARRAFRRAQQAHATLEEKNNE